MIFNEKKKIKRNTFTANPPFVFICPFPKGNVQGLERLLSLSPMGNQTLIPRRPYQMLNCLRLVVWRFLSLLLEITRQESAKS